MISTVEEEFMCPSCHYVWNEVVYWNTFKLSCPKCRQTVFRPVENPFFKKTYFWGMKSFLKHLITGWCGNECDHVEPYGWVPECGCPIHDPDKRSHIILSKIALFWRESKNKEQK